MSAMQIDVPSMEGRQGYIQGIFNSRMQLRQIFSVPELGKNAMGIYWCIKIILQDEIRDSKLRKQILEDLNTNIEKKKQEYKTKYNKDAVEGALNYILIDEAINSLGEATNYNDKYLAIGTENKIQVTKLDCASCVYRLNTLTNEEDEEEEDTEPSVEELYPDE